MPFDGYGQSGLGLCAVADYTEEKNVPRSQRSAHELVTRPDLTRTKKIGSQRKASGNGAGPNPVGEYALEGKNNETS